MLYRHLFIKPLFLKDCIWLKPCKVISVYFSTSNYHNNEAKIHFNRKAKLQHKKIANLQPNCEVYEYIKDNIAFEITDRISDVKRDFPLALDLGCGSGHIIKELLKEDSVKMLVQGDICSEAVQRIKPGYISNDKSVFDDEGDLPFRENTFDLVCSNLSLHWVNDVPKVLKNVWRTLRRDGCFLGAVFGGDTLFQLRCSLQLAEQERFGGMGTHVSPFMQGHDLANLMSRAKFNMVTLDMDSIIVNYPTMFELMDDLKGMGENNAIKSVTPLTRDTLLAASAIYQSQYANEDGSIPATFQILYFIGWKPDPSQPKPLARGSAPKGINVKKDS